MLFVLVLAAAVYALYRYVLQYERDTRKTAVISSVDGPVLLLTKGLLRSATKRQGKMSGPLSEVKLHYDVDVDTTLVSSYERVTTFAGGKAAAAVSAAAKAAPTHLSLCYPQALTASVVASLVTDRGFPLSPLGILHMKQTIVQHAPIPAAGQYHTETWFSKHAETDKGIELTVSVVLSDKRSGSKLWEGETLVLSRGAAGKRKEAGVFDKPVWTAQSTHAVSGSTGLRYAGVSGDYNPHHLYWWSAMPMGFSRPIAHGMWTLSAALHELAACGAIDSAAFPQRVSCEFKKPLLMPTTITFGYRKGAANGSVEFGVYCKDNVNPHIMASVQVGK